MIDSYVIKEYADKAKEFSKNSWQTIKHSRSGLATLTLIGGLFIGSTYKSITSDPRKEIATVYQSITRNLMPTKIRYDDVVDSEGKRNPDGTPDQIFTYGQLDDLEVIIPGVLDKKTETVYYLPPSEIARLKKAQQNR